MIELNKDKYLLSIITCYTKQKPSGLRNILELIKGLKASEVNKAPPHINSLAVKKHEVTADKALEYTCWLVKADNLYDVTLQTYDIGMVLQVAKHTQKDPKEYLPYLKELQELEPVYMKYKIQKDLKQYNLALVELAQVVY
jgi:elongator complex protein 1